MDIIAMAVALKKAISQTKDIIASHFVAGTNIEITDNPDGTQTINASGEVSATDEVARQAIADHEADINNPHSVTKNQIGLGNVDNTSDADKPISTATQTALDSKQPTINSSNPLSSDSVDDTNSAHKFATAAELTQIATNTGDINTINGFLENTKIESWNIADTGRLYENTYVDIEGGGGVTHSYEPYFTLADIEIPAGATTLYFDCTALENQDAGAYSMFFMGSFKGFIPTGKSIAIPNNSYRVDITFPYVDGDYTNKTKGKYYISFETPTGRYDTITIDGVSTNVVPKEVLDDELNGKQDTISDLATIRSNATSGAGAAEVVTGINSTANSYIEMKSGKREYLSTTVPTGNIPIGSVGMGWAEGVYTFKSGTKVSEGEPTANLFDKAKAIINKYVSTSGEVTAMGAAHSDYISVVAGQNYYIYGVVPKTVYTQAIGYDTDKLNPISLSVSDSYSGTSGILEIPTGVEYIIINCKKENLGIVQVSHSSTPLPYEPYGKKFPFYANGQPLTDYVIYGADGGVGEKTANLTDTRNFVNSTTDTRDYFQARLFSGQTISDQKIDSTGRKNLSVVLPAGEHTLRLRHSGANTDINIMTYSVVLTKETAFNCSFDVIGYNPLTVGGLVLDNIMLNEGDTALPYESYGYKIPVICGGQTTNIYLDNPLDATDSIDYTTSQTTIPTVDGANSLMCDTTVQPSKVSLTYTGWHSTIEDVYESMDNKQDTIDSSHKLSADLVDDTNTTNKFVTSAEKTTISKAVTTDDIGLGTDYVVYNGIRLYISSTEPTGNIPDGSYWIGG